MSLISRIYFSSNRAENLSDLENDKNVLAADFSSRGFAQSALLDDELNLLLPKAFSEYTEKVLMDGKESQLIQLSSNFISDCEELMPSDLIKANEKINQHFKNISFKRINKLGIDDLPKYIRIVGGLLLGSAFISYFEFDRPIISLLFVVILIAAFFIFFRNHKSNQRHFVESWDIDFVPQLNELVRACKEAKNKEFLAFYYWSL